MVIQFLQPQSRIAYRFRDFALAQLSLSLSLNLHLSLNLNLILNL